MVSVVVVLRLIAIGEPQVGKAFSLAVPAVALLEPHPLKNPLIREPYVNICHLIILLVMGVAPPQLKPETP
jgi:hypothetical protein